MALAQLMNVDQNDVLQDIAAREVIEIIGIGAPNWGRQTTFPVTRDGDFISKLRLQISVEEAPPGFRWKRLWPLFFVKRLGLEIGGGLIWNTNTEALQMKYRMDGFATTPEWNEAFPNNEIPALLRMSRESLFDYESDEERTQKSRVRHTCLIEPICLKELTSSAQYPLPLLSLPFHEIKLTLLAGQLEDCLERIDPNAVLPLHPDRILRFCTFLGDYHFVGRAERQMQLRDRFDYPTKHLSYQCYMGEKPAVGALQIRIHEDYLCSAAYVWITDEQGNELPQTVMDSLEIKINGQSHTQMTSHMSRFGVRENLPHPTIPNTVSPNFYYISYFPGRRDNGVEQGLNLSAINLYTFHFTLNNACPQMFKIHILHRIQNSLMFRGGMAGLRFVGGVGAHIPVQVPAALATPNIVFQNINQRIPIPADEPACMFSYEDHKEGDVVQQCLFCKKVFNSELLDKWFVTNGWNKQCIHCRQPYSTTTFRKGKAHLGPIEENAEQDNVQFLAAAAVQHMRLQQPNIIERLFGRLFARHED